MRDLREFWEDDRGVSSAVTHSLALGITAILISGLLFTSGTLLEDQRENSAREQLETVGNRIANDLSRASTLAQDGGNATFQTRHPTQVAGEPYQVALLTGDDCSTNTFNSSKDACLALEMQDRDIQVMVPVRNRTPVELAESSGKSFTVSASVNETADAPSLPPLGGVSRVGVARDVGGYDPGASVNATNQPPISGFTFSPGQPTVADTIHFQNDTQDLDGVIESYEWEISLDGGGNFTESSREFNRSLPYGKHDVTLTVTDDDGETDSVSKTVSVSGLFKEKGETTAENVSDDTEDGAIHFEVNHTHTEPIDVQEILIDPILDPEDGGPDRLRTDDDHDPEEIVIDGEDAYEDDGPIHAGGGIFELEDGLSVPEDDSTEVEFNGFENGGKLDMNDVPVFVAIRYETANGSFYTSQFVLFEDANLPPNPWFTYSCDGRECEFDPGGSNDRDGVIDEYEWDFGDGDTATSGPPGSPITHEFPANASYDVSLTVTDDEGDKSTIANRIEVGDAGGPVVFALNAGGEEYEAVDRTGYEADTGYENDEAGNTNAPIDNTTDEKLYQSYRETDRECGIFGWFCTTDEFNYEVPDLDDGDYRVTLKFAETEYDQEGEREFDIHIEGEDATEDPIDIYERTGEQNHAYDVVRTVEVNDGQLDIESHSHDDSTAIISAIKVQRAGEGGS